MKRLASHAYEILKTGASLHSKAAKLAYDTLKLQHERLF